MTEEPDNFALPLLRTMRAEAIREDTVSAIGFAANASPAHVDPRKQIPDLTLRVEKLEAGR